MAGDFQKRPTAVERLSGLDAVSYATLVKRTNIFRAGTQPGFQVFCFVSFSSLPLRLPGFKAIRKYFFLVPFHVNKIMIIYVFF